MAGELVPGKLAVQYTIPLLLSLYLSIGTTSAATSAVESGISYQLSYQLVPRQDATFFSELFAIPDYTQSCPVKLYIRLNDNLGINWANNHLWVLPDYFKGNNHNQRAME